MRSGPDAIGVGGSPRIVYRGRGSPGGFTSYIWHSIDVRAELPPFSALPGILLAPFFFNKMYMTDPIFFISI